MRYGEQLAELLAEGPDGALLRERTTFDSLSRKVDGRIVLHGAGSIGRKALLALRSSGGKPLAFSDRNPKLAGMNIEGIPVLSPEEAAKRYGSNSLFVVCVWNPQLSDRMADRIQFLESLGCRSVIAFPPLFWQAQITVISHSLGLPHTAHREADRIRNAFDLLADDESRSIFVGQLRWRLLGDFAALSEPMKGTPHFPEFVNIGSEESLIDCGACTGDTIIDFVALTNGRFSRIISFEPDPQNYQVASETILRLPENIRERIQLHQAAVARRNEIATFDAMGNDGSRLGTGAIKVQCVSLDEFLKNHAPTYIKMDIEGAELEALAGAGETIKAHRPRLAISCDHLPSDLWNIPLFIHRLHHTYTFRLRVHLPEAWDTDCYATVS